MAILAVATTVAGALQGVKSLFESIGIRIKGATKHLTYDQASQIANAFGGNMISVFHNNYTVAQLLSVMPTIKNRWIAAMDQQWGRQGINANIAVDIEKFSGMADGIEHMAQSFALWCAINSDAARPDDFATVFAHYWNWLFVSSFEAVGLDSAPIKTEAAKQPGIFSQVASQATGSTGGSGGGQIQVTATLPTTGGGSPSINLPGANVSVAGLDLKYIVAAIAIAVALSVVFKKGGK